MKACHCFFNWLVACDKPPCFDQITMFLDFCCPSAQISLMAPSSQPWAPGKVNASRHTSNKSRRNLSLSNDFWETNQSNLTIGCFIRAGLYAGSTLASLRYASSMLLVLNCRTSLALDQHTSRVFTTPASCCNHICGHPHSSITS